MKKTLITAAVLIGLSVFAPASRAQIFAPGSVHDTHFLTFDAPIALPDGTTLPAGTYLFSWNSRDRMTRISSEDRSKVYASLLAIPVERATPKRDESTEHDIVVVRGSANAPPTLKAWFCPGNPTGHEFASVKKAS